MSKPPISPYRSAAAAGIASPRLQKSLHGIQERFGKGAMALWAELEDKAELSSLSAQTKLMPLRYKDLRGRVKKARLRTLGHLDIVLAELADKVRARGGRVFFAATAADAIRYTLEVAKRNKVKRVVKGKSMTSMEIDIDPALAGAGIEVVETDLGEYIIQLAGDRPSHIIAPCIHLDRHQIGELFTEKLGIDATDDPPTLTMAARRALRAKMLGAEMGLTGCNLACAETGQISLVSNEGNIRMATTMPPVHVALMGMERVVATMDEHRQALQLLTRGAALQKLSTYVSFLGGPAGADDPDGPREFHLVILDNGRSRILADPEFREVLACLRCGACLNICPVYGRIGGHAYHSPYCGPIGAVVTPLLDGINKHADLCKGETLCGACKAICPVEIDLPRMLAGLRHKLAYGSNRWNTRQHSPAEAAAFSLWRLLVTHGFLYRALLRIGWLLQRPFVGKNRMIARMAGVADGWTDDRDLPPLAGQTFAALWKKNYAANRPPTGVAKNGEGS